MQEGVEMISGSKIIGFPDDRLAAVSRWRPYLFYICSFFFYNYSLSKSTRARHIAAKVKESQKGGLDFGGDKESYLFAICEIEFPNSFSLKLLLIV